VGSEPHCINRIYRISWVSFHWPSFSDFNISVFGSAEKSGLYGNHKPGPSLVSIGRSTLEELHGASRKELGVTSAQAHIIYMVAHIKIANKSFYSPRARCNFCFSSISLSESRDRSERGMSIFSRATMPTGAWLKTTISFPIRSASSTSWVTKITVRL